MIFSCSSVNSIKFCHYFHQQVKYWKELVLPIFFLKERSLLVAPLTKLLRGKSYNGCRRKNLFLATAINGLYLERFIEYIIIVPTNLLQEFENCAIMEDMSEVPSNLQNMVTKNDSYLD